MHPDQMTFDTIMDVPSKIYYKIGEVARYLNVKPHVLRYWETEFQQLKPEKNRTGQRLYKRKDVETLFEIKRLLYNEKFSIAGAKKALGRKSNVEEHRGDYPGIIDSVRDQLKEIVAFIDRDATA